MGRLGIGLGAQRHRRLLPRRWLFQRRRLRRGRVRPGRVRRRLKVSGRGRLEYVPRGHRLLQTVALGRMLRGTDLKEALPSPGVTVNAICPELVETDSSSTLLAAQHPLDRLRSPPEPYSPGHRCPLIRSGVEMATSVASSPADSTIRRTAPPRLSIRMFSPRCTTIPIPPMRSILPGSRRVAVP